MVQLSCPYMNTEKTIAVTRQTFVGKVMSLLFNTLSMFVIALLPRSNFVAAITIHSDSGAQENKIYHCFHFFPFYLTWSDGLDTMISYFLMLIFKPTFSFYFFTLIKRFFSSSSLPAIRAVSSAYLGLLIFLPANLIPSCASVSQETGKVIWYSLLFKNFPQFVVIHIVKSFSVVHGAEIEVFLEFPCFLHDPTNVGNLIFASSVFSKSSLYKK